MSGLRWFAPALIAGTAAVWAGVAFGAWWLAFLVGLVVGLVLAQEQLAIAAGSIAGLLGWSLPLTSLNVRYGLGPAAQSLAAIMGLPATQSVVPVVLTCAIGLLLGLTGAWLGSAARSLLVAAWPFGARRPAGHMDRASEIW